MSLDFDPSDDLVDYVNSSINGDPFNVSGTLSAVSTASPADTFNMSDILGGSDAYAASGGSSISSSLPGSASSFLSTAGTDIAKILPFAASAYATTEQANAMQTAAQAAAATNAAAAQSAATLEAYLPYIIVGGLALFLIRSLSSSGGSSGGSKKK